MTGGSWRLVVGLTARGRDAFTGSGRGPTARETAAVIQSLAFGTGDGQADTMVCTTRTLAAGASETLDLFAGTDLKTVFNQTANFSELRSVVVWIDSGGDSAGVTVGNAALNPHPLFFDAATYTQTIYPSGAPLVGGRSVAVAVTATVKNLKVLNNSAVDVTYGLALAGSGTANATGTPMGLLLALTYA